MLGKTSVSMMVLLVAASLIGIGSIHEYIEGQTPTPTPKPEQLPTQFVDIKGQVLLVIMFAGGACNAWVQVSGDSAIRLGVPGGSAIILGGADQHICTSFGLAKIGKTNITFDATKGQSTDRRIFSTNRVQI